jgi:predicted transcriptional regulator
MPSQIIGVRFPAELRERVVKLAGPEHGALSDYVRQAVADALEREDEGPPDDGG